MRCDIRTLSTSDGAVGILQCRGQDEKRLGDDCLPVPDASHPQPVRKGVGCEVWPRFPFPHLSPLSPRFIR